jgi:hypothetical protein
LKPIVDPGIECVDRGDYLLVTVHGVWTEDFARKVIDTARAEAVNCDRRRILLDLLELSRPEREFTRYLSGKYLAEAMGSQFSIAAFGRPENITRYAETVAQNRGATLTVFTDQESALEWLLRQP